MVYIVRVNYTSFRFYDPTTAMSFAELATRNIEGDNNEVSIELENEMDIAEPSE